MYALLLPHFTVFLYSWFITYVLCYFFCYYWCSERTDQYWVSLLVDQNLMSIANIATSGIKLHFLPFFHPLANWNFRYWWKDDAAIFIKDDAKFWRKKAPCLSRRGRTLELGSSFEHARKVNTIFCRAKRRWIRWSPPGLRRCGRPWTGINLSNPHVLIRRTPVLEF